MFARIRDAFPKQFRQVMERLDVQIIQEKEDGWAMAKCPLCPDQSGSAGIHTRTGMLKCHQCGFSGELFEWIRKKLNLQTPWNACEELAKILSIDVEKPVESRKKRIESLALNEEAISQFEAALWGTTNFYQGELAARGFTANELMPYRLGRTSSGLLFPAWNSSGLLQARGHLWRGPKVEPRWMWWPSPGKNSTGTGSPIGLWPLWLPPDADRDIWLMEGEWDCLIARVKFGLDAYTWTGGAGSPLIKDKIPSWMTGRTIHVVYDIDVYHGQDSYDERNKNQRNLLNKVLPILLSRANKVLVHWVPLDVDSYPKGDFRDWWGQGGRDLKTLHTEEFNSFSLPGKKKRNTAEAIKLENIGDMIGKQVKFIGSVAGVTFEPRIVYEKINIKCDMDNHRACSTCRLSKEHQDGEIDLAGNPGLTARLFLDGDIYRSTKQWLHPGPGCPGFEIEELEEQKPAKTRWLWQAGQPTESEDQHIEVTILSPTRPAMAKDHTVVGWVAPELTEARPIVEATEILPAERMPFSMSPKLVDELKDITPWSSDNESEIISYLDRREEQIAEHTTEIYGMPWARAIEIAAHSSIYLPRPSGRVERGWIDCCLVGYTRTGKTTTARRLLEHYGLGRYASAQSSVSKAGITVTLERTSGSSNAGWRAKPGIFPKLDGQMLVLDEMHGLVNIAQKTNEVFQELQSARDIGTLEVVKAVNVKYQARVRLVAMANPPHKLGFAHYTFPCEVIRDLYCTDEAIARTDYMVVGLSGSTGKQPQVRSTQRWPREFAHALIRRAWDSTAPKILIPPEVERKVEDVVELWIGQYSQDLPLFTAAEKARSLLRISIAIANLCFSHDATAEQTVVRQAHVGVARAFMEECYKRSGYDIWSSNRMRKSTPQPFVVERMLWVCIERPSDVQKFEALGGENGRNQLSEILGLTTDQASMRVETWISRMLGAQGIQPSRPGLYVLTDLGRKLVSEIAKFVVVQEDTWRGRIATLDAWLSRSTIGATEPKPLDYILQLQL